MEDIHQFYRLWELFDEAYGDILWRAKKRWKCGCKTRDVIFLTNTFILFKYIFYQFFMFSFLFLRKAGLNALQIKYCHEILTKKENKARIVKLKLKMYSLQVLVLRLIAITI